MGELTFRQGNENAFKSTGLTGNVHHNKVYAFVDLNLIIKGSEYANYSTTKCSEKGCITMLSSHSIKNNGGYCWVHCQPNFKHCPENKMGKIK